MSNYRHLVFSCLVLALAVAACGRSDAESRVPLGMSGQPGQADPLSASARAVLDRGNEHFRAARFVQALAEYRTASREAPQSASPFFGILMAAQKVGDKPLADSASAMIRRLSGSASPESVHGSSAGSREP